jgi:prepilin peptidase CpaA
MVRRSPGVLSVLEYALFFLFPAAMAFAGAYDLMTMTIPNRITVALVAVFPIAAFAAGLPMDAVLSHIAAGAIVLSVAFVMFAIGWLGGGDAKLVSAAAIWVGLDHLLMYVAQVSILGGVLAVLILMYRQFPVAALPAPGWALKLHEHGSGIPYGLAIAGGSFWIYPETAWFQAFLV